MIYWNDWWVSKGTHLHKCAKNKKERKMETITSNKRVVAALGALTLTVVGFCVIISYMW
jgi:hypothetical protein